MRRDRTSGCIGGRYDSVPGLAEDSVMTTTLVTTRRDGLPWTTIRLVHEGLPVEWLDDVETYWSFQLAIADVAGFGVAS